MFKKLLLLVVKVLFQVSKCKVGYINILSGIDMTCIKIGKVLGEIQRSDIQICQKSKQHQNTIKGFKCKNKRCPESVSCYTAHFLMIHVRKLMCISCHTCIITGFASL